MSDSEAEVTKQLINKLIEKKEGLLQSRPHATGLLSAIFIDTLNNIEPSKLQKKSNSLQYELSNSDSEIHQLLAKHYGSSFMNKLFKLCVDFMTNLSAKIPSTALIEASELNQESKPRSAITHELTNQFFTQLFSNAHTDDEVDVIWKKITLHFHSDRRSGLFKSAIADSDKDKLFQQWQDSANNRKTCLSLKKILHGQNLELSCIHFLALNKTPNAIESSFKTMSEFILNNNDAAALLPHPIERESLYLKLEEIKNILSASYLDFAKIFTICFSEINETIDVLHTKYHTVEVLSDEQQLDCQQQLSTTLRKSLGKNLLQSSMLPNFEFNGALLCYFLNPNNDYKFPAHIKWFTQTLTTEELVQQTDKAIKKLNQPDWVLTTLLHYQQNSDNNFARLLFASLRHTVMDIYKTNEEFKKTFPTALAKFIPAMLSTIGTSALASIYIQEIAIIGAISLFCYTSTNPLIRGLGTRLFWLSLTIPVWSVSLQYKALRLACEGLKITTGLINHYFLESIPSELITRSNEGRLCLPAFNHSEITRVATPFIARIERIKNHHWFAPLRTGGQFKSPIIEQLIHFILTIDTTKNLTLYAKLLKIKEQLEHLKTIPSFYESNTKKAIDFSLKQIRADLEEISKKPKNSSQGLLTWMKQEPEKTFPIHATSSEEQTDSSTSCLFATPNTTKSLTYY